MDEMRDKEFRPSGTSRSDQRYRGPAPLRPARNPSGISIEVLLVEDDEADAYIIEEALAQFPSIGNVVRARDGVEALALVDSAKVRPDIALIDLNMPRMDGLQLLEELNSRVDRDFPMVVLTSSDSILDVRQAFFRGVSDYCTKKASIPMMTHSLKPIIDSLS